MPTNPNAIAPSLVNELNELKRRLAAVERKPDVLAKFDRYPSTEWAAIGRGKVADNKWSSCGIANVTGLVYDRVECKFITDRIITGKAEAEIRLAAFRHYGNAQKECVSASDSFIIRGSTSRQIGTCLFQWIHSIPFGWDYSDEVSIYTIELQHRYVKGPTAEVPDRKQLLAFSKGVNTNSPDIGALKMPNNENFATAVVSETRPGVSLGWVTVSDPAELDPYDGSYNISNMHYCVGLTADRATNATTAGWGWYRGGTAEGGAPGNINDPFI
ncbi:hypothetical protein ACFQ7F_12995 [Streptomyces sp. NPDC056486]|uniref:hypothetical protein n=1 Tax=Streptomyces sp. NPDC056486 TaxID=3345835 RepID=UPI0036917AEE